MAFFELELFPDFNPSEKSDGGPGFDTNVIGMDSGQEQRIERRSQSRHSYNAAFQVRSLEDVYYVQSFHRRMGGSAHGFRYRDLSDYTSTSVGRLWGPSAVAIANTDQVLGTGDGTRTAFQLVKVYGATSPQHTRTITKPRTGTVVVAIDGADQASGWTVNTTTGVVTFSSAPALGEVVTAGFQFDVPVRFGVEVDGQLRAAMQGYAVASISQIPLIELLDERSVDDRVPMRGSELLEVSADVTLDLSFALWVLDPQSGSLKAILPDLDDVETGGPILAVANVNGSNAISIRDAETDTEQFSLGAGAKKTLWLGVDASDNKVWHGF